MPASTIDPRYLALLRRYDTPTVCNVIELFDVRPRNQGFMDRSIGACFRNAAPIVGYATTATFRSAQPAERGDVYTGLAEQVKHFLEAVPEPRIVVFEDLDGDPAAATFGEVMCSVYKSFGCVGLITSGAARDLEQVDRLGFPCFASSTIASHGYCRTVEVDVPVTVGGLRIAPCDVLHADANGVTTIPGEIVPEIALGCQKLMDAENLIITYAGTARPTVDGLRAAQEECRARFDAIPAEVRRELGN